MEEEKKTKLEITKITTINDNTNKNPNPIASLISKFQGLFNRPPPPQQNDGVMGPEAAVSEEEEEKPPAAMVRVPRGQAEMPSLRLEEEEICSEQNTNPLVLWQVYAIGGFFVLRWVLARWNERRARKKPPSNDEPSPADD